ncbi:hypothetical protein ACOI6D_23785 [Klebsiella sp. R2]|uniref:hypothetical protein n=1 Tax=Klebsiella sp. R2 TaxID=3409957 RepID=UPI003B5CF0CF
MIQSRNKYLQFMLVMLAAWAIAWGALFVMGQTVLLYGLGKNTLFFIHGAVLVYLLCVFLVYRRWVAPLPVVGQLRNVGAPWLVGAMAVVYVGEFLLGKVLDLPAERGLRANDVKNHVNRLTYCFILIIRCCIYSYSNDHGADGRWNAIPSRLIA